MIAYCISLSGKTQLYNQSLEQVLLIGLSFGKALFFCLRENNKGYYAVLDLYCDAHLSYNVITRRCMPMTARERIIAIKLLEKQERKPEYAERIGIQVSMVKKDQKIMEVKNV